MCDFIEALAEDKTKSELVFRQVNAEPADIKDQRLFLTLAVVAVILALVIVGMLLLAVVTGRGK